MASCHQYKINTQGSVGFSEEDARLIAAAPELLDALLDLVALLPDPELDRDEVQRGYVLAARAVIAKATGEAA